jgi:hypothetical protein
MSSFALRGISSNDLLKQIPNLRHQVSRSTNQTQGNQPQGAKGQLAAVEVVQTKDQFLRMAQQFAWTRCIERLCMRHIQSIEDMQEIGLLFSGCWSQLLTDVE